MHKCNFLSVATPITPKTEKELFELVKLQKNPKEPICQECGCFTSRCIQNGKGNHKFWAGFCIECGQFSSEMEDNK